MTTDIDTLQAEPESFMPTPEKLASFSFLDLKREEAHDLLLSVQGRKDLLERILLHADDIRMMHPDFNPAALPDQLEDVSALLLAKQKFLESTASKEKKTLFQRALTTIREFPKNHPFITAALAIACLMAGLVRLGYIKLPSGGFFGFGEGGAGLSGAGDAVAETVAGAADTAAGNGIVGALPEAVRLAVQAAEQFAPTSNDFIVIGRQILFGGTLYDADHLEPLVEALRHSGIDMAEQIRIFRDESARVTAWQGLQSFLQEQGIEAGKVTLVRDLLQSGQ